MAVPAQKRATIQDYLAAQDRAPIKLEFVDGQIVTQAGELWEELEAQFTEQEILGMTGGTYAHARLIDNVYYHLRTALNGTPCRPHGSESRFLDPIFRQTRYPDAMVTCGPPEFDGGDPHAITNPKVVFEALSTSTAGIDRGEKAQQYRATPSVQAIVFVDSRRRHAESLTRQDDGTWLLRDHPEAIGLPCIGVDLKLDDLYDGVPLDG